MGELIGRPQYTPYEMPVLKVTGWLERLPTDNAQLHILCPAGVGDNLWILSKFWSVVQHRQVTFWLPAAEQQRSADVFRMAGLTSKYSADFSTEWVWSRPGEPPIPETGAKFSVQPNRHLEHGHRIEKWYAELPFENPAKFLNWSSGIGYKQIVGSCKYVIVFFSHQQYMEDGGNLHAGAWARICRRIERDIAPVLIIGAGKDVDFIGKVLQQFDNTLDPVLNRPLEDIAALIEGSEMVVGAHAGPLILSTYMNKRTFHFYPRWLKPMPGTWEHPDNIWGAGFLDEAELLVTDGLKFEGNKNIGVIR